MMEVKNNDIEIFFIKIHEKAKIPRYEYIGDSGADLFTIDNILIKPGEICLVSTGICIALSFGIEAQIRPKSGLSLKGLSIVNSPATIDSNFRGELKVPLINLGKKNIYFSEGEKFAQIIFAPIYRGNFIEVEKLSDSDRGDGGFGSTGL